MSKTNTQFGNRTPETLMDVRFEMARLRVPIDTLLNYSEGTLIELNKLAGETFDVCVNKVPFGKGEAITTGEQMGIRFTEIFGRE
ncbi:MAG: hypothetical protein HN521_19165 [Candidatus Latescibacteria bacterium]|jgi:flagellar motor switch protein FliN|nr:hypothetical protein [Candidatus Latescibacterota bacterium]